jgi:hypothetical protein
MSLLKKIILIVISVFLFSLTTLPIKGYCDDWVYVGSYEEFSMYYKSSSVNIDKRNHIIKVWINRVYTENGKNEVLKYINDIEKQKYVYVNFALALCLLNYREWKYGVIQLAYYSKSGNVLGSYYAPHNWRNDILPDSIDDKLFDKIVKDFKIKR